MTSYRYTGTKRKLIGHSALGMFYGPFEGHTFKVQVNDLKHRYAFGWWKQNPAHWSPVDPVSAATDIAIAYYDRATELVGFPDMEFVWNGIATGCNRFPCNRDEVIERFAERKGWTVDQVRGALRK